MFSSKLSLKRITVSTQYLSEIDGLRFLAIFPVLFLHLGTFYLRNTNIEWSLPLSLDPLFFMRSYCGIGVPIFYCLSGFILCLPFGKEILEQKKKISVKQFYGRRLTRLEPPYIVALTVFLGVHIFILGESFSETFPHYVASLFYVHSLVYGEWSTILPVAWTLEIEVQFYLLAPFFARFYFRKGLRFRRVLIVILMLVFVAIEIYCLDLLKPYHLDKSLLTKAHYFLGGVLVCDLFISDRAFFKRQSRVWDALFMIAFFSSTLVAIVFGPGFFVGRIIFTVSLVIMFLCAFRGVWMNRIFTHPWTYLTGGMCYTLYLLHYPFFHFTGKFIGVVQVTDIFAVNILLQMLWNLPLLALVVVPFYLLIERPCMDRMWPQILWGAVKARLRKQTG